MGKKLDALQRGFETLKFIIILEFATYRLGRHKKKRQAKFSTARDDVIRLLRSREQHMALLKVEQVIKEQNMLDVLILLESYCRLLIERFKLLELDLLCPEELKEAVWSLMYAASTCGEFPRVLQKIREIFTSRYGSEFARAIESCNCFCGVIPEIIQKLRMPSLDNMKKVLKDIAYENNINLLPLEDFSDQIDGQRPISSKPSRVCSLKENGVIHPMQGHYTETRNAM